MDFWLGSSSRSLSLSFFFLLLIFFPSFLSLSFFPYFSPALRLPCPASPLYTIDQMQCSLWTLTIETHNEKKTTPTTNLYFFFYARVSCSVLDKDIAKFSGGMSSSIPDTCRVKDAFYCSHL